MDNYSLEEPLKKRNRVVMFKKHLTKAQAILWPNENEVPEPVIETIRYLSGRGIWFQLSRNHSARSCRDAARKRNRLGHEGIPIWDELKSYFGQFKNARGHLQLLVAHCRGGQRINLELLAKSVQALSIPERLTEKQLTQLDLEYGSVNPFISWESAKPTTPFAMDPKFLASPILQVFDEALMQPIGIPGTIMTNAGDLTWAVEFYPNELVDKIDHVIIERVAEPDPVCEVRLWGKCKREVIGIITGNAPESGIALWQHINNSVRDLLGQNFCGDISMPHMLVHSLPEMGLSMELDGRRKEVWQALKSVIINMCHQGVNIIGLACHTTHFFTPEIRKICEHNNVEFISMPEAIAVWLKANHIDNVALLGIKYVSDLGKWSAYKNAFSDIRVDPLSDTALELIQDLAYQIKTKGVNRVGLDQLWNILRKEVPNTNVVLALTELSLLLQRQRKKRNTEKLLIDPLLIYGDAIAHRYLGIKFPKFNNQFSKQKLTFIHKTRTINNDNWS